MCFFAIKKTQHIIPIFAALAKYLLCPLVNVRIPIMSYIAWIDKSCECVWQSALFTWRTAYQCFRLMKNAIFAMLHAVVRLWTLSRYVTKSLELPIWMAFIMQWYHILIKFAEMDRFKEANIEFLCSKQNVQWFHFIIWKLNFEWFFACIRVYTVYEQIFETVSSFSIFPPLAVNAIDSMKVISIYFFLLFLRLFLFLNPPQIALSIYLSLMYTSETRE